MLRKRNVDAKLSADSPADIYNFNNQSFSSENLVKNGDALPVFLYYVTMPVYSYILFAFYMMPNGEFKGNYIPGFSTIMVCRMANGWLLYVNYLCLENIAYQDTFFVHLQLLFNSTAATILSEN